MHSSVRESLDSTWWKGAHFEKLVNILGSHQTMNEDLRRAVLFDEGSPNPKVCSGS